MKSFLRIKKEAADGAADSADGDAKEATVIDIEPKEEITFDQFGTMQFQVGEIIACEEVKKSRKLLCSQVKIGSQVKQTRIRHQGSLYAGRDGRKESYGACQPEACETGRRTSLRECFCALKTRMAICH